MWISRRKADALEKRIADLELQVQSQQEKLDTFRNLWIERQKFLSKSSPKHHWDQQNLFFSQVQFYLHVQQM